MRDLLYVIFRHRLKVLLFFVVTVSCAVAMVVYCARNIYRSNAQLRVISGTETLDAQTRRQQDINVKSELKTLRKRELVERVVDGLGSAEFARATIRPRIVPSWVKMPGQSRETGDTPTRDESIRHLSRGLRVSTGGKQGNQISLAYESPDPNFAQEVLAKFIEVYLAEQAKSRTPSGSYQFFAEQSDKMKSELTRLESELHELKASAGISDFATELQIKLSQIGQIKEQMNSAQSNKAGTAARIEELAKKLEELPETLLTQTTTGLPNTAADAMRSRLYELQLTELDYLTKYNEDSRQVQDIRQRIKAAMDLLDYEESSRIQITHGISETREGVERSIVAEEATKSSLEAQIESLARSLKTAEAEVKQVNDVGLQIKQLEREIQMREANYLKYAESLEQARIDQAMNPGAVASIKVEQAATLPTVPVKPNKTLVIALGTLLGILGSVAVAFLCETADQAIKTPEGAQKSLQLPTLVSVPRTAANRIQATTRRRGRESGPGYEWDVPHAVRGRFEQLSDQVWKSSKAASARKRVIGITSSRKGEGVSITAANVAALLAEKKRVLLIDTNVENPCSPAIFDMKVTLGLLDVISNRRARKLAIWKSPVDNLDIMPVGTHNTGRHDLKRDDLSKLITLLKKDYDCIVLDLPAVNEAGYSARLASLCDNVSLIIDAEHSHRDVVKEAQDQLLRLNANLLGVVLNKRRFPIPEWIYRAL